jgi:hypothetical protein
MNALLTLTVVGTALELSRQRTVRLMSYRVHDHMVMARPGNGVWMLD